MLEDEGTMEDVKETHDEDKALEGLLEVDVQEAHEEEEALLEEGEGVMVSSPYHLRYFGHL